MSEPIRDMAWVNAVRDRVLAELAANPSIRPYLGEDGKVGHRPRTVSDEERRIKRAAYKRKRRAEGVSW